jgi:hypothetical protein
MTENRKNEKEALSVKDSNVGDEKAKNSVPKDQGNANPDFKCALCRSSDNKTLRSELFCDSCLLTVAYSKVVTPEFLKILRNELVKQGHIIPPFDRNLEEEIRAYVR